MNPGISIPKAYYPNHRRDTPAPRGWRARGFREKNNPKTYPGPSPRADTG